MGLTVRVEAGQRRTVSVRPASFQSMHISCKQRASKMTGSCKTGVVDALPCCGNLNGGCKHGSEPPGSKDAWPRLLLVLDIGVKEINHLSAMHPTPAS